MSSTTKAVASHVRRAVGLAPKFGEHHQHVAHVNGPVRVEVFKAKRRAVAVVPFVGVKARGRIRGCLVVVASRVVLAAGHLQLVAHPVAVVVGDAIFVAGVVLHRELARAVLHIGSRVVVACSRCRAPRHGRHARPVVHCGRRVVVRGSRIGAPGNFGSRQAEIEAYGRAKLATCRKDFSPEDNSKLPWPYPQQMPSP